MATTYNVTVASVNDEQATLKIGFGDPASNDKIVVDAKEAINSVTDQVAGKVILLNGPASLPVAVVLSHALCHIGKAVGVYDPKLGKYVVAVSHDPAYAVGDLI